MHRSEFKADQNFGFKHKQMHRNEFKANGKPSVPEILQFKYKHCAFEKLELSNIKVVGSS